MGRKANADKAAEVTAPAADTAQAAPAAAPAVEPAKEEAKTTAGPKADAGAKAAAPAPGYLPKIGDIVHYFKRTQTGNGQKLERQAALVLAYPAPTSNFQPKDFAVTLKIFTAHGDPVRECMFDVTGEQKDGRWGTKA